MGPRGLIEWRHWLAQNRTEDTWRRIYSRNTHKWQQVTRDHKAFISKRDREGSSIRPSPPAQRAEMKRPHDYSSPDSDTDEFIDVGQEDSYWWASAKHTCSWSTILPPRGRKALLLLQPEAKDRVALNIYHREKKGAAEDESFTFSGKTGRFWLPWNGLVGKGKLSSHSTRFYCLITFLTQLEVRAETGIMF